jgi:hypothetical protein
VEFVVGSWQLGHSTQAYATRNEHFHAFVLKCQVQWQCVDICCQLYGTYTWIVIRSNFVLFVAGERVALILTCAEWTSTSAPCPSAVRSSIFSRPLTSARNEPPRWGHPPSVRNMSLYKLPPGELNWQSASGYSTNVDFRLETRYALSVFHVLQYFALLIHNFNAVWQWSFVRQNVIYWCYLTLLCHRRLPYGPFPVCLSRFSQQWDQMFYCWNSLGCSDGIHWFPLLRRSDLELVHVRLKDIVATSHIVTAAWREPIISWNTTAFCQEHVVIRMFLLRNI